MRFVDDETRAQIAADRLIFLEKDQASSSKDVIGFDDDVWEPSDVSDNEGAVSKRKSITMKKQRKSSTAPEKESMTTRGTRRQKKPIETILMDEPLLLPNADTFHSVWAPPASKTPGARPPLKLCSVCSNFGSYNCTRCGSCFCCINCMNIHKDTKCLKFAD
jgi:zinc finger HIT domain-containing protein 1